MKFRVDADGRLFELALTRKGQSAEYRVTGEVDASGSASVVMVRPGVYSILSQGRSFTVHVSKRKEQYEVSIGDRHGLLTLADARDRPNRERHGMASGPVEIRAQMPGKIITILVSPGKEVRSGESLLVIEAMKMQNEMKSPKEGTISKILVSEGESVAAGYALLVIE